MRQYFNSDFSSWFAPPWAIYNRNTKKICDELGFRVFSGGVSPRLHARLFDILGRSLNLNTIASQKVSYHKNNSFTQSGFKTREISVGVDTVYNYGLKQVKSPEIILARFQKCKKHFNVICFLLHQWVFNTDQKLDVIRQLLLELKKDAQISFKLIDFI